MGNDFSNCRTEIVRCLRIRHASLFDQPHRLKLELACKLPPFHDSPPIPSKHLTRCLQNRVQATCLRDCSQGRLQETSGKARDFIS